MHRGRRRRRKRVVWVRLGGEGGIPVRGCLWGAARLAAGWSEALEEWRG